MALIALLGLFCLAPVSSQSNSFSSSSARGNTEMSENISGADFPNITFSATAPKTGKQVAFSVQLLLILTVLTLAPSILILCTSFLRFSIVLDFIKRALSLQQVPPTAVLNGIALFMTIFCMWPTLNKVYTQAYRPLSNNEITLEQAVDNAKEPIKEYMLYQMRDPSKRNTYSRYIADFARMAKIPRMKNMSELPMYVLVPAYILHELTAAFKIGVLLYIPFIIIDMVVASILMSMGMMMLPPVQISMPFKLMLFVLVDGWGLLTGQLFASVL